jgi:hypothetical protein
MKRECKECGKKRDAERFVGERGRICDICRKRKQRETARTTHLAKTYNITPDEYALLAKDGCNICGGSRPYNLQVDHDHEIAEKFGIRESVRGVLCKRCNKLLRDIKDNPEIPRAAIEFLLNPPAKRVLFP